MPEQKKQTVWWWTKTVLQGLATTAISFTPEILGLFPEHTLAFKLAIPAGFLVKYLVTKTHYEKDTLPSGVAAQLDKVPNSITGVRGSKK